MRKGAKTFIVYTTLHKCQPGLGDLTKHTLNIRDLLALIYHALVEALSQSGSWMSARNCGIHLTSDPSNIDGAVLVIDAIIQHVSMLPCVFCICVRLCLEI